MINQRWAFMPILTGKMDKVNLPFFYQLGAQLNPLTKMKAETGNRLDILINALNAKEQVNWLVNWSGGLSICLNSARAFIDATDHVINWYKSTPIEERQKDDFSVNMQFQLVIDQAKTFETVLSEELATLSTYSASKKGIYSTSDLIEKTGDVFPPSVLAKLDTNVVQEIKEAGKCLAFDIPTASGFHMLRATEEVLHEYYIVVCQPENKTRLDSWSAYISVLHKFTEKEANNKLETVNHVKKVLGLLQQIKDQDRNLIIMHPEVVLKNDEAFILFEITKGAIMTMAELLTSREIANVVQNKTQN